MSSEWPKVSLGSVADVFTGFAFKGDGYLPANSGVRVVRGDNVTEHTLRWGEKEKCWPEASSHLQAYDLHVGDIVIGMDGSKVGKNFATVKASDCPCLLAQRVARVRAKAGVDQTFLSFSVCNSLFTEYVKAVHTGTSIPHISKGQIERFDVYLPPLSDQIAIGSMLRALDDRIALLRETNATLEAIAQALFKSWFVDFDPVRARMEGRAPEGMDEATAALFPDSFEESELGLVPKGWRVGRVEDLCSIITNGGTPSRSNKKFWDEGTIPWFKTGDFNDGFLVTPAERITDEALKGSSAKLLPENAVLMAIYAAPTVGRLGVLTEPATFNQACTGMVAADQFGTWFLYWTLYFGRSWFNSRANGAAQQNISKAIVASYRSILPAEKVLAAYNEVASSLHLRIRACSEKAQTLATLRDTLLPRLISGQLRLPDAEAMAPETA